MNTTRFVEFAKKLYAIDSPSGYTKKAIDFLEEKAKELGYATSKNQKGNLHTFLMCCTDGVNQFLLLDFR